MEERRGEEELGSFDVIVVGAGIMGSCAAYEAARRGRRTLLLEQFDLLHPRGSSHGESRTIRATYPEPYYPPLVLLARRLWALAESASGYRVLTPTPHLDLGPATHGSLRYAIAHYPTPLRPLAPAEAASLYSGAFRLPDGWIGVQSDLGGVIRPTKAVAMFQSLALKHGAVIRDRTEVTAIDRHASGAGVRVTVSGGGVFLGRKCVVAAGAWTRKLVESVSGVALPVQPLHTVIWYWRVKEGHEREFTTEAGFPTFASYGEPLIYGTPSLEFPGLIKIAVHGGRPCHPDRRDWGSGGGPGGVLVGKVARWIEELMPGRVESAQPVMTQECMYSMTPDEDYIIDFLGGEFGKDVVVAAGFSGHGFKMGPAVGRILAEMAIDGEAEAVEGVDMGYFRIGRFDSDPKGNAKQYESQVSGCPNGRSGC